MSFSPLGNGHIHIYIYIYEYRITTRARYIILGDDSYTLHNAGRRLVPNGGEAVTHEPIEECMLAPIICGRLAYHHNLLLGQAIRRRIKTIMIWLSSIHSPSCVPPRKQTDNSFLTNLLSKLQRIHYEI